MPIVLDLLERYEWVFWIDADALIVEFSRDIVDELPESAFLGLVEHAYDGHRFPNTGVMIVRSSPVAREFWSEVWARTEYVDHPWWENAAVLSLLGYRVATWPRRSGEGLRPWPWRHSLRHLAWHVQCRLDDYFGMKVLRVVPRRGAPPPGVRLLGNEWNSIPADPSSAPRVKHYPGQAFQERVANMQADAAALDLSPNRG